MHFPGSLPAMSSVMLLSMARMTQLMARMTQLTVKSNADYFKGIETNAYFDNGIP